MYPSGYSPLFFLLFFPIFVKKSKEMGSYKKLWPVMAFGLLGAMGAYAQNADFDLNSQRSELQDVRMVPGKKLNHHGWVLNPTPHRLEWTGGGECNWLNGFAVKDVHGKFGSLDLERQNKHGVRLVIDFGSKKALRQGVKPVSGAYTIAVNKKGIHILGYDERGAFYGIQTLKQLMMSENGKSGILPYLSINDYPDLPDRGVVEGFYGTPWSHEVRLSLIDFYGKFKLNTYLYGPKDDPYHSCPNWRLPYPEKEATQIKELVEACRRNYVDFVWAIHPGQDIKWNEEDYQNLVKKFNWMYDLGVRSFAIFFDDISGAGTNPAKQVELLNRLTKEFVQVKGDVASLTVCPTDYSKLWANPTPQGSLAVYGQTLHPSIKVFWTGDVVCSDLTPETMKWVNSRIKRPAYYWWNFPVTDYARHIIMQGPAYGLDTTLTAEDLCGLVSNPMEHGEASKLALYGVADYTWNVASYNPLDSWERGLEYLAPEVKDAYRTFAIHSCDTETGYRRAESWETKTFRINDSFSRADYDALLREFKKISGVEEKMKTKCRNKLLMQELEPWLTEFTKLGIRGARAMELLEVYKQSDWGKFWAGYVNNVMSAADCKTYEAHKSGTMKLQPFYETTMDDMRDGFFCSLTGMLPATLKGIGSFATLATTQSKLMFDNDSTTYYHSGASQGEKDSWIGADLGCLKKVWEINILQGRNSKDDVDYFDHATLEYSADGKTWTPLIADMKNRYVINWKGNAVEARYIRLRKLASAKRSWVAVRSFEVNPVRVENLGFSLKADGVNNVVSAFDKHLGTSCIMQGGTLVFGIPAGTESYTLLAKLEDGQKLEISQLSASGKVLSTQTVDTPLFQFSCVEGATHIAVKGSAEIFEIIGK